MRRPTVDLVLITENCWMPTFRLILWCAEWRRVYGKDAHIRMVIDNVSAVAWTDTRNTKHPEAQCVLRIMGLLEATSHVFTSSEHIPGEKNV